LSYTVDKRYFYIFTAILYSSKMLSQRPRNCSAFERYRVDLAYISRFCTSHMIYLKTPAEILHMYYSRFIPAGVAETFQELTYENDVWFQEKILTNDALDLIWSPAFWGIHATLLYLLLIYRFVWIFLVTNNKYFLTFNKIWIFKMERVSHLVS
jgi:hypothetical protein